jgi:hypothetical protein
MAGLMDEWIVGLADKGAYGWRADGERGGRTCDHIFESYQLQINA